jgi:formylglycine-generating enzyme required for sulfatase activity
MQKNNKLLFFIGILFTLFAVMACHLPFKIVPNYTPTPTVKATQTILLPTTTQSPTQVVQVTPTPENQEKLVDTMPATGSKLTWIDYSNFVFVPPGEFIIGKDSANPTDFSPRHTVSLVGFWIQQSEVTNQQYAQCVSDGRCSAPIQEPEVPYWYEYPYDGNHPVVGVNWFQAREYCQYIQARLPSEAEWEAAARGSVGKIYPWGGDKPNCNYLNFKGCLDPSAPADILTYQFGASDFDVFDMAGNVSEWVEDWYSKDFYTSSPSENPTGPSDGRKRVYRGGSYASSSDEIGSFLRFATEPENQASDIGFRCVLAAEQVENRTLTMGRPCQILAMSDQNQASPTSTPFPCTSASVNGFCQLLGGKPSYGIEILQSGCLDNTLHSMTANIQPLTCSTTQLSNGTNKYQCTFPGMAQGINVNLSYCHSIDVQNVQIACPSGYQINQKTHLCEVENSKLPSSPCPHGYLNVATYGCLPLPDSVYQTCPIGYYSVDSSTASVCMPINTCLLSTEPNACKNTNCSAGQKFDAQQNCCITADSPMKICPSDLIYNADQNACIDPKLITEKCHTTTTNIPLCPTLTPTATPTKEPQGKSCSDYTDGHECINNGCKWAVGFFYCY